MAKKTEKTGSKKSVTYFHFNLGERVSGFSLPCSNGNALFSFDTVAGRYIMLACFSSSSDPEAAEFLKGIEDNKHLFSTATLAFFAITADPKDEEKLKPQDPYGPIRFFYDTSGKVYDQYGNSPQIYLLDLNLRVIARSSLDQWSALVDIIPTLPDLDSPENTPGWAPVIPVPRVFDAQLCRDLIDVYRQDGGHESGSMVIRDGRTVEVFNHRHKRRRDFIIQDAGVIERIKEAVRIRVAPEIYRASNFLPTRIERFMVANYNAEDGGHFMPHRDNTTPGTAHRRFAVSINLNEDFEGGDLIFPEYGKRRYRPTPGGAIVFSGSLLHQVTAVSHGERFACLPFLYDEEAAQIRISNAPNLGPNAYRPGDDVLLTPQRAAFLRQKTHHGELLNTV